MRRSFNLDDNDIIIPFDFLEMERKSFDLDDDVVGGIFVDPELLDFFLLTEDGFFLTGEKNEKIII